MSSAGSVLRRCRPCFLKKILMDYAPPTLPKWGPTRPVARLYGIPYSAKHVTSDVGHSALVMVHASLQSVSGSTSRGIVKRSRPPRLPLEDALNVLVCFGSFSSVLVTCNSSERSCLLIKDGGTQASASSSTR